MAQTILVPLDGSLLAERALDYAKGFAQAAGGRIVLLRVVPAHSLSATSDPLREITLWREAELYLQEVTLRLPPVVVETDVPVGDVAPQTLAAIPRQGADLVVMSTHGRSGLGRWVYGSVADQVMRQATVPVVLVSATATPHAWPIDRPPRILLPLDYSRLSEAAVKPVESLVPALCAELILLSITPLVWSADAYDPAYLPYDMEADQAGRQRYLDQIATRLRTAGSPVKTRIDIGFPASVIVSVVQEEDVDLIAMATHGSGGITRLVMGSTATGVVQRAPVPVLLVRSATASAIPEPGVESQTVGSS